MSSNSNLSEPSEEKWQARVQSVSSLVCRYVHQLLNGCGSSECKSSMCATGRRIADQRRHVRKWTPRSARAIAVAVASGPTPKRHLCPYITDASLFMPTDETHEDGIQDPTSFMQLLSDSAPMRHLCSGDDTEEPSPYLETHSVYRLLAPVASMSDIFDYTPPILSNQEAVARVMTAIQWLLQQLRPASKAQREFAHGYIMTGHAFPSESNSSLADDRWNSWLSRLDDYNYEPHLRLLSHIAEVVSLRSVMDHTVHQAAVEMNRDDPCTPRHGARFFMKILCSKLGDLDSDSKQLWGWLHRVFFLHWDGTTLVKRGTVCCGALELLECLETFYLPLISAHLDTEKVATSWMNMLPDSGNSLHLLNFKFIFSTNERITYFRMMNHLRMREMNSAADKTVALSRRMAFRPFEYKPEGMLEYAEEHYLLLNVSRENVLRDAYDQLWQRRKSDLLRPLRVRLGEIEELEMGHDLGGVQIEFFNLVCKQAFAEENQMFTTEPRTGVSYFRQMSLQPLYMFELLGTLFGLALHNGIILPVTLPLYFYLSLLWMPNTQFPALAGRQIDLDDMSHGWSVESRSLLKISENSDPPLYLDYAFPVEANGLRMTVTSDPEQLGVLHVHDVTAEVRHAQHDERKDTAAKCTSTGRGTAVHIQEAGDPLFHGQDTFSDWPGWQLKRSVAEPPLVTNENKKQYVTDYATWILETSVAPQLKAFKAGFEAIMTRRQMSFFTSKQLKYLMEGTSRLNIDDLRKATRYEGYDAKSKYIQSFWRIVGSWSQENQKGLLKFVTAAERIPIGGASHLRFVIEKSDYGEPDRLPSSSTCFGVLSLPQYETAQILESKLEKAILYGNEGFGSG